MPSSKFEDIVLAYDQTIDWKKRIHREIPFVIEMANGMKGKRVLDLACGTGRHAIELSNRGATVTGLDSSPTMIDTARSIAQDSHSKAEFIVGDMAELKESISGEFDFVLCLGNSLSLLPDVITLEQVISDVHDILRPGGKFLYQVLNFEEILQSDFRFMPAKEGQPRNHKELVFFRFFTHNADSKTSSLVLSAFEKEHDEWTVRMGTVQVLQLDYDTVYDATVQSGFYQIKAFSSYDGSFFNPMTNRDLIIVGKK